MTRTRTAPASNSWHALNPPDVLARMRVDASQGLTVTETETRRLRYGLNEWVERGAKSAGRIIWDQFAGMWVAILVVAAVVSFIVGDLRGAGAILAIVLLNAILGFVQEYRAEQAMAALKKPGAPTLRVRREGELAEIPAIQLVPGDIVFLETGNRVPADGRLLEVANLRIQEAILTGEPVPAEKMIKALEGADLPLEDQRNMAFMGTMITQGRGQMVTTETGMATQLGRVAGMIRGIESTPTPHRRRLRQLGRGLALAALPLIIAVFGLGLLRGEDLNLMLVTSISIAVAVVPEGLPVVVTFALILGARRMLRRHARIRKLSAVETLGSVTVICSDKTGTLTENRMMVTLLDLAGHRIDLTETCRHREPVILPEDPAAPGGCDQPALNLLLVAGALCNDAGLRSDPTKPGQYHALGEPAEGALVVAAARFGIWQSTLTRALPRIGEVPFDSERKRMTTVHRVAADRLSGAGIDCLPLTPQPPYVRYAPSPLTIQYFAFTKGTVDGLMEIATHVWVDDHAEPLDAGQRERVVAAAEQLAGQGMRVLGVAFRSIDRDADTVAPLPVSVDIEQELTLIGLVGMIDPPRTRAKAAVETCQAAGIRPVMITGDQPLTARQIAQELGISANGRILTGREIARMSVESLQRVVEEVSVFARISPEQKLNIVQALQNRGHVVAMTGDSINDAPALKRADVGVAMGMTGADVSKAAASMVLLDDDFATIVSAVEEGRGIYDNIRKFVSFSLAGNVGKVLVVLVAPLLGLPLPLNPLQVLYMNLVADGVLGLGMSMAPVEQDAMRRPSRRPTESIFGRGLGVHILWVGGLIGLIGLGVGLLAWGELEKIRWGTLILTTLIFAQVFQALATRSTRDSVFKIDPSSNRPLLAAVLLIVAVQLVVLYAPFLHELFGVAPLSFGKLFLAVAAGSLGLWASELQKWLARRSDNQT